MIDTPTEPFDEHHWAGIQLNVGTATIRVDQPTVRCAMPLRAQPGLAAQPKLFDALNQADPAMPNHLGVYATITKPGVIEIGDEAHPTD